MVEERVIEELCEYFKFSRGEVIYKLDHSWDIYQKRFADFNKLTQEKDFALWYDRTNQWYSEPEVHIFEQTYFRYHLQPAGELKTYLDLFQGNVLDFGCGIARFSLQAFEEKRCEKLHLVDTSSSIRVFLDYLITKRNLTNVFVSSSIPLGMEFDRIFILDMLEHIPDPIGLLRYLKTFLKKDGMIVGAAPFHENFQPGHLRMHKNLKLYELFKLIGLNDNQFKDMTRR